MALRYPEQLFYEFLNGEQRMLLSYEISMFDREIRKQRLRRAHPEWSDVEVMNEIIRQSFKSEAVPAWLERKLQQRVDEHRPAKPQASNKNPATRYTDRFILCPGGPEWPHPQSVTQERTSRNS
jgi:hypothetical protein